ncbi:hypothetical protein K491DRAFT_243621 [Lophiostoma macrostomum CBS 122681]|uniref:Uncharacterized protein n=1 Tax=Lophiostoma macrostomum CBS 122681 TaxID=1314788 RepID=A0A6A6TJD8_9PLEO|nr:hypothetical protein K491DRAFT_243621 [Lophiostoma macrostomum CBS 122681]
MSRTQPSMRAGMRTDAAAPIGHGRINTSSGYPGSGHGNMGRDTSYVPSFPSTTPFQRGPSQSFGSHFPLPTHTQHPQAYAHPVAQPVYDPSQPTYYQPQIQQPEYDSPSNYQRDSSIPPRSDAVPEAAIPSYIPPRNIHFEERTVKIGKPPNQEVRVIHYYADKQDLKKNRRCFVLINYKDYIQWIKEEPKYRSVKPGKKFMEDGDGVLDMQTAPPALYSRIYEEYERGQGITVDPISSSTLAVVEETLFGEDLKGAGRQMYIKDKGCTENIEKLYNIMQKIDRIDNPSRGAAQPNPSQRTPSSRNGSYANVGTTYEEQNPPRTSTHSVDASGRHEQERTNRSRQSGPEADYPDESELPPQKREYTYGDYTTGPGYYKKSDYLLVEFRRYLPCRVDGDGKAYRSSTDWVKAGAGLVNKKHGEHVITLLERLDLGPDSFRVERFPRPEFIEAILEAQDPEECDLKDPDRRCTVAVYEYYWSKQAEQICQDAEKRAEEKSRRLHERSRGRKSSRHG